ELGRILSYLLISVRGKERIVAVVTAGAEANTALGLVAEFYQRRRIGNRKVLEQDGVYQREDGRICADSQGKCQHGCRGEPRSFAQLANRKTHVLPHVG